LNPDAAFVFWIIGVAGILFASGRVRLDVTALLVVMALMLSGVLTVRSQYSSALKPFSYSPSPSSPTRG